MSATSTPSIKAALFARLRAGNTSWRLSKRDKFNLVAEYAEGASLAELSRRYKVSIQTANYHVRMAAKRLGYER